MTSLMSDQIIMDLLLDRDKEAVPYFSGDFNFDVDDALTDFDSMFGADNDVLDMFIDPKRPLSLDDGIESDDSSPTATAGLISTDSEDSPMEFQTGYLSSSSSGFSDSSPAPAAEEVFELALGSPTTYATFEVEEVVEDTTLDMGICEDVEILTTDTSSGDDFEGVSVIAEFIPTEVKVELSGPAPRLRLTEEEKKLLGKEGISIPEHLPLTKAEEKNLKRIRRKIRNKESAQNSRKRKKEYVDGLESRVKMCTTQNMELKKKISQLSGQNQTLVAQVRKLQAMVAKANGNKPAQASACALVLLLSLGFFLLPSLRTGMDGEKQQFPKAPASTARSPFAGNSRSLLDYTPNPSFGVDNKYGIQASNDNGDWHQATAKRQKLDRSSERLADIKATAALRTDFKFEEPMPVIDQDQGELRATNLSNTQSRTIVVSAPTPHHRNAF